MKSIRVFLVVVILAVITLFSFVAALKGYQSSMAEAETLFDKQLQDTARLIAAFNADASIDNDRHDSSIAFQVWQRDQLIVSSAHAPLQRMATLEEGFDYSNFNGYRWRTFVYFQPGNQNWVVVAERTDLRYALAESVVLESIFPVLIGLPLVALLIWVIVGKGLKPLRELADELGNKRPDDLGPVSCGSTSQELKRIVNSSNQLLERLEDSLLRERQFASDAAHELRTPISVLKVQLHNVGKDLPDDNPNISQLAATADRLGHIVEQILDLYRSSPDKYNAALTRIDLTGLVRETLAQEYPRFEAKEQDLEFEGEQAWILGDRFGLTTLLRNLLSNSNKYTPAGGHIKVAVSEHSERVTLAVEDSGSGIPEHLREAVFKRFYRVGGDQHQSGEPGCGLGLAIVKRITESHDAEISIQPSGFASGTAVHIHFPTARDIEPSPLGEPAEVKA